MSRRAWSALDRRAMRVRRWLRNPRPVCMRCFHELREDELHDCGREEVRDEQRLARAWLRKRATATRTDTVPTFQLADAWRAARERVHH